MCRVILVEDDVELRNIIIEELDYEGLRVDGVGSSIELYQTLIQRKYDIVLLDVGLPDQSGLDVAQYLRDKTAMGIIMLTAYGQQGDKVSGYQSGADLYFVKPVDCGELAAAIHSLYERLGQKKTHSDNAQPPHKICWRLNRQSWELISPDNKRVRLTAKEVQFLQVLTHEGEEVISRTKLLQELSRDCDQSYGNKALEVLVNRLRKKIKDITCQDAPIKTIHAVGYYFSSDFEILS